MAHSSSSSSESGDSAWSTINLLLAGAFTVFVLYWGVNFVLFGAVAAIKQREPKPVAVAAPAAAAPAPVAAGTPSATTAPAAAVTSGSAQELVLKPDAVNPMAYNTKAFTVKAGQLVRLTFNNQATVPLPHNVVVGKAGSKDALNAASMKIMTDPNGMTKGYIPDNCPEIIAHTKLVQPGQTETIEFTPASPGDYPYMCMFPGHSIMMNGVITAQ